MVEFRLDPSRQQLFDITRRAAVSELERGRQERLAPIIQRVGLGSPAIVRGEREAEAGLQTNLLDLLSRLGEQQAGEARQERLVGEERGERRRMTRAQFLQRSKEQERQIGARESELETQQQFAQEQQQRQFEFSERLAKEERDRQRKLQGQNLLRGLIGTGLNLFAPGIGKGIGALFGGGGDQTGGAPFAQGGLSLFQQQPNMFGANLLGQTPQNTLGGLTRTPLNRQLFSQQFGQPTTSLVQNRFNFPQLGRR